MSITSTTFLRARRTSKTTSALPALFLIVSNNITRIFIYRNHQRSLPELCTRPPPRSTRWSPSHVCPSPKWRLHWRSALTRVWSINTSVDVLSSLRASSPLSTDFNLSMAEDPSGSAAARLVPGAIEKIRRFPQIWEDEQLPSRGCCQFEELSGYLPGRLDDYRWVTSLRRSSGEVSLWSLFCQPRE